MLLLLLILLQINPHQFIDSYEIWNKTLDYIKKGKMNVPKGMNYFIFDEFNFTGLDINGGKMKLLFQTQKEIYENHSIPNYIFAVSILSQYNLDDITHGLAAYLKSYYGVNSNRTIILLLSTMNRNIRIRTGESLRKCISDSTTETMISNLEPLLKKSEFYNAWYRFFSDINYYYNLYSPKSGITYESGGSKDTDTGKIVAIITFIIVGLSLIIVPVICTCRKFKKKFIYTHVLMFLRSNKDNDAIFQENCALCLLPFNNLQIQNTTQTEFNSNQQKYIANSNNIITLKCGHKFHNLCVNQLKLSYCPICLKMNDPLFKGEKTKIIWGIQQDIYPFLKSYNYDKIFKEAKVKGNDNNNSDGGISISPVGSGIGFGGGNDNGGSYGGGSVGGDIHGSGGAQGSW